MQFTIHPSCVFLLIIFFEPRYENIIEYIMDAFIRGPADSSIATWVRMDRSHNAAATSCLHICMFLLTYFGFSYLAGLILKQTIPPNIYWAAFYLGTVLMGTLELWSYNGAFTNSQQLVNWCNSALKNCTAFSIVEPGPIQTHSSPKQPWVIPFPPLFRATIKLSHKGLHFS